MSVMRYFLLSVCVFCMASVATGQNGYPILPDSLNPRIVVKGKVTDQAGRPKSDLLIINDRINAGTFGNANGSFSVYAHKHDTLIFGAFGYGSVKVCFADSTIKETYTFECALSPLHVQLASAEVLAPRDLDAIQRDIDKLGFHESDYRTSGVDALQSPITFLYEQFSRREQSRRKAIELQNDDNRRELLKELFVKYVDYEIIALEPGEFDDFITFIGVTDDFLQAATQYDFLLFVKKRYQDYRVQYRMQQLLPGDFDYDQAPDSVATPSVPSQGN